MTTATLSDNDVRIRDAVIHQLDWDPEVDASGVGVAAKDGSVTLTGFIDSYSGKLAAERAAKKIRGVRAVANDLQVRLRMTRTDDDIARDAARALELDPLTAGVQCVVHGGHLTLSGSVPSLFRREHAEQVVRRIRGVAGLVNRIEVEPAAASAKDVRYLITQALHRNADLDARHLDVSVSGSVVRLTGEVTSWAQREAAERAASLAPGVSRVETHIAVKPPES
jgi:osmotically-inducible protein OsmY